MLTYVQVRRKAAGLLSTSTMDFDLAIQYRKNYAGRTSPNPAYEYYAGRDRTTYRPERFRNMEEIFELPEYSRDARSNGAERHIWHVSRIRPTFGNFYFSYDQQDFYDSHELYPTIEYFTTHPVHETIAELFLQVRFEQDVSEFLKENDGPTSTEQRKILVLHRVLRALTTLFQTASTASEPFPPKSLLAVLRTISIHIEFRDGFGDDIHLNTARLLHELEVAFEKYAKSVEKAPPVAQARIRRFPLSMSYKLLTSEVYHDVDGRMAQKKVGMYVMNHLRIGGLQEEPTWAMAGWNPLNASRIFRPPKHAGTEVVEERRVRGKQSEAFMWSDHDNDWLPVIYVPSPFSSKRDALDAEDQ